MHYCTSVRQSPAFFFIRHESNHQKPPLRKHHVGRSLPTRGKVLLIVNDPAALGETPVVGQNLGRHSNFLLRPSVCGGLVPLANFVLRPAALCRPLRD